jgi:putative addiction module component (TIGR02574 family)
MGARMIAEEIKNNALRMNPIDRIRLAEILLESLDKTDEQIEQAWAVESEKRFKAYKEGRVKGIPIEQLRSRTR